MRIEETNAKKMIIIIYQFNPELEAEFVKLVVGVSLDIQPVAIIDNKPTMCFFNQKNKTETKQASKEIRRR